MNRIKEYRLAAGMKQVELCRIVGITQGALSGWENGKYEPDLKSLKKMSELFGTTIDELMGFSSVHKNKGVRIPVYGSVAAGIPIEAITDIEDYEDISEDMARNGEYIALRIKGHSMEPVINFGDVVIVRLQDTADDNDIAIVIVNGDEATCKRIKKSPEGVALLSANPHYSPMFYTNEQIENLPVRILGKVVELRRTLSF